MKPLRTLLLASLVGAIAGPASAQIQEAVIADAVRNAATIGPVRISTSEGFNLSAGAPTAALDLIDVRPSDAFVIEGPVHMAMEGFVMFVVDCAIYSGDRVVARFNRSAPVGDGPFSGRFRFGLARTGEGAPTSYGCWANGYGTRGGANWRAYEVPDASVAGGYAQFVKYADGSFWDGAAITQQVVLHFSGLLGGVAQPAGLSPAGLSQGPRIPDGSNVQWRPPIIPPLVANEISAARAGGGANDWRAMQDFHRDGEGASPSVNLPRAEPVPVPQPHPQ